MQEIVYRIRICFSPFEKGLSSPVSLARNREHLGTHLKEELTNFFSNPTGYSLFLRKQSRQKCANIANMVNILTLHVRDSLEDKLSMLFTHF